MAASGIAAGQSNVTSSLMQQPTVAGNPTVYSYNSASLQQQQQYAVQQQRISLQNQVNECSSAVICIPLYLINFYVAACCYNSLCLRRLLFVTFVILTAAALMPLYY